MNKKTIVSMSDKNYFELFGWVGRRKQNGNPKRWTARGGPSDA